MERFPQLDTETLYRARFADAAYWAPYVELVCARHGLRPCRPIRSGLPGTYPTFAVAERWVVKLFGRLFDGAESFAVELEANRLVASVPALGAPPVVCHGRLFGDEAPWPWPYIVFEHLPGLSAGEVWEDIAADGKTAMSRWLGHALREMYAIDLEKGTVLAPRWDGFLDMLERNRSCCVARFAAWGKLPGHLLAALDDYLAPVSELIDTGKPPRLVHCDLTEDHVIVPPGGTKTSPFAVIDFGDAMAADPLYELPVLHTSLFRCDKGLLSAFLEAYGAGEEFCEDLPKRAMCLSLLHRWDVLGGMFERLPRAHEAATLQELADMIWNPAQ